MKKDILKTLSIFCLTLSIVPIANEFLIPNLLDGDMPIVQKAATEMLEQGQEKMELQAVSSRKLEEDFVKKVEFLSRVCPRISVAVGASEGQGIAQVVEEASESQGVSPDLVLAMIAAESKCNPQARSRAGAMGLMQLMPRTAQSLGIEEPFSVRDNVLGGARYISRLLDKYNGDTKLALAAYNSGPDMVDRFGGMPPIRETQKYVQKVLQYRRLFFEMLRA